MVSFRFLRPWFFCTWNIFVCPLFRGLFHLSKQGLFQAKQGSSKGSRLLHLAKFITTSHDLTQKVAEVSGHPLISGKARLVKYHNLARLYAYLEKWPVRGSGSEAVSLRIWNTTTSLGKMSSWRAKRAGGFTYVFVFPPQWGKTSCT